MTDSDIEVSISGYTLEVEQPKLFGCNTVTINGVEYLLVSGSYRTHLAPRAPDRWGRYEVRGVGQPAIPDVDLSTRSHGTRRTIWRR